MSSIVILAGAGRSGTTILKDVLSKHKDIDSFEFEMNSLWKMGNEKIEHDRLSINNLMTSDRKNIKKFISRASANNGKKIFIDKTVANVMRLHFISELLPESKIIYLERDGRAVAVSASKRWEAKEKNVYYIRKILAMPLNAKISIIFSKLKSLLNIFDNKVHEPTWGALWPDYEISIKDKTTIEKCALQWNESVLMARSDLSLIDNKRYIKVRYENILADPSQEIKKIIEFLELDFYPSFQDYLSNIFHQEKGEAWKRNINNNDIKKIEAIQKSTLLDLGYIDE